MKPVIGITTFVDRQLRADYTSLSVDYSSSVAAAGGLPFLLPLPLEVGDAQAYLDAIDGVLFSGGVDVSPLRYGALPARQVNRCSLARDELEIALALGARERGMPVFGICRGLQLLNVAFGGSLVQDIAAELPGSGGHYPEGLPVDEPYHYVEILEGDSLIGAALGPGRVGVNSFHHQAVRELAPGLRATARSLDGIIEAFEPEEPSPGERSGGFLMALQFHPECLTARFPEFLGLFAAHVAAAEKYRATRR
jgi:putative glutamine amidotransferase